MHPWAFSAAVMGRAIYRQSPEAFWAFKEQIYSNQDGLNIFTLEDFVRGFVQDHQLDLKKWEADVASKEVSQEILDSIGAAYSVPVGSTPTFLVNGEIVNAGEEGKNIDALISKLLEK
jgi:protein-disulfide isomerase